MSLAVKRGTATFIICPRGRDLKVANIKRKQIRREKDGKWKIKEK